MAASINASTSAGVVTTADTTGNLNLQSNGTTVLAMTSAGVAVTGTQSVSGAATLSSTLGVTGVTRASGGLNTGPTDTTPFAAGDIMLPSSNAYRVSYSGYGYNVLSISGGIVKVDASGIGAAFGGAVTIPGAVSTSNYYTVTGGAGAVTVDNTGLYQGSWPTTASPANTNVANANYARLVTSLRANKTEITSISEQVATDTVMAMRGVTYRSAIDDDQREWAGFIAEETKDANPTLAMFDDSGALQSISYDRIPAYMIPVLQKHEREIQTLRAELQQLRTPQ